MKIAKQIAEQSRLAWRLRQSSPRPPVARSIIIASLFIGVYLAISAYFHPSGDANSSDFLDERGTVTILSALLLGSGAAWALATYIIAPWCEKRYRVFWLVVSMAIAFLAVDELFGFHERGGWILQTETPLSALVKNTPLRNLNDLIVILYGVVALACAFIFLPAILRVPRVLEMCAIAFGWYALHTLIDSVSQPPTGKTIILEESAKTMSSCFIALAMLVGLRGTIAQLPTQAVEPEASPPEKNDN